MNRRAFLLGVAAAPLAVNPMDKLTALVEALPPLSRSFVALGRNCGKTATAMRRLHVEFITLRAEQEAAAFINGSGVGRPLGLLR